MYENIFAGFAIDTNDPALADSFVPIPEAVYPVAVESIEQGVDKSGGVRFTAKVRIREGALMGRVVNDNYNLGSANPQAVEIARKQLAALARACGVSGQLTNPRQVVNVPTFAKIGPQKDSARYSRIIAWLTPEAAAFVAPQQAVQPAFVPPPQPQPAVQPAPMQAAPVPQPAAQPAAAPAHKMPWEQ